MATQEPRFSRRFLTILILVTSMAIALLTRLEDRSANDAEPAPPDLPEASAPALDIAPDQPVTPNTEPGP